LNLVRVSAAVIFAIPFVLVFTLRNCSRVEEPAFRRVPLDLFRVIECKVGESYFTEHCFLKRGRDKGIELAMPACQGSEKDSDGLVVKLVCEN
jgi:hypothetical protein